MKLLKVSVPNFRNLQNVELTFEPDLSPAVFPIASQNGGGKSTLLQLIFTLFHGSVNNNRHSYIRNLIKTSDFLSHKEYVIAQFEILHKQQAIKILFKTVSSSTSRNHLYLFELGEKQRICQEHIYKFDGKINALESVNVSREFKGEITETKKELSRFLLENKLLMEEQADFLIRETNYINSFSLNESTREDNKDNDYIFVCEYQNVKDHGFATEILNFIGENIFLAAPSTQPFIFLTKKIRKKIFTNLADYCLLLSIQKEYLPNLYLYNQLTVQELTDTFSKARNEDWKKALQSNNLVYGSSIKKLTEDFHDFLGHDKYILPTPELDSIIVQKQISETERIELEPEDLSHGELRRLGLYAWIKYNIPENSIILIDEVENALHPDWQYNIADELASWGNNQYLLATHSFHLCEALTPKHVKEIEPKMFPKEITSRRKPTPEAVDND